MSITLYSHNQQAYDNAVEMLKKGNKACIIHPTGTGKTYIAFKFIEDNRNKRILWLGPSEYIFRMQLRRVGEDDSDLRRYVVRNDIFHTYAWLSTNGNCILNLAPDIIILDEFHRAGAPEWGINVRKLIEAYPNVKVIGFTATNIRYLDSARDMAIELFDGSIASEITLIEAMARGILPVPKYVIATYDYEERLNIIQSRNDGIRSETVKRENQKLLDRLRRNLEQSEGLERIFAKHITKHNGKFIVFCTSTEKMYEMIARVVEWFHDIDRLPHVYAVHCYNPESEKEFRDFVEDNSNHTKLLFSIDMLNEGIHVPDVDGVILLRPTDSPIVYKQQIGRALSIGRKSDTIIFDMVNNFEGLNNIHGFEEEYRKMCEYYIKNGETTALSEFDVYDELKDFRELFEAIMRNLESTWDMYYAELIHRKAQTGSAYVERRYVLENGLQLGKWLSHQKQKFWEGRLEPERKEKLLALGIELRRLNDVRFENWIALLENYKESHSESTCVPSDYVCATGEKLGIWVSNIRKGHEEGRLSKEQVEVLESMGFAWNRYDAIWEENYLAAKQYYEEHHNLRIPKRYIDSDGKKIGLWLSTQRQVYFGTVPGNLSAQKIEKLEQIGMIWNLKQEKKDSFAKHFRMLEEYVKENGNAYVKADYVTDDGVRLGAWVAYIRAKKQQHLMESLLKPGEKCPGRYITIEQERQLNAIGFHWNARQDKWDVMYELALAYYKEHGKIHGILNSITDEEGRKLNSWLHAQNEKARNAGKQTRGGINKGKRGGDLSEEKMAKLATIGIPYNKKSDVANNRGVAEYKKYLKSGGDSFVYTGFITHDGYALGKWCSHQRNKMRKHTINFRTKKELDALGFIWDKYEYFWENMFNRACDYYNKHNETLPSASYICDDGAKLGQWISSMRRRIRKNNLSTDRIERLKTIGIT